MFTLIFTFSLYTSLAFKLLQTLYIEKVNKNDSYFWASVSALAYPATLFFMFIKWAFYRVDISLPEIRNRNSIASELLEIKSLCQKLAEREKCYHTINSIVASDIGEQELANDLKRIESLENYSFLLMQMSDDESLLSQSIEDGSALTLLHSISEFMASDLNKPELDQLNKSVRTIDWYCSELDPKSCVV